jgi:hypothetical protein
MNQLNALSNRVEYYGFVETRESKFADASLEKIIRSVSNTISTLTTPENKLAQEI